MNVYLLVYPHAFKVQNNHEKHHGGDPSQLAPLPVELSRSKNSQNWLSAMGRMIFC